MGTKGTVLVVQKFMHHENRPLDPYIRFLLQFLRFPQAS